MLLEKQHNLETKPQLDDALALAAKAKNTTPEIILNQIIKPIAFHESDQTMDANLKQYGDGPARGLMQFEPARFSVSVQRAKNYYSKKLGQAIPEWINSIDLSGDIQKEITTLSGNQQMALAVLDLLEHPEADLGMVVSGKKTIEEFQTERMNVILKARQLGISTLTAGYALWMMTFHKDKNILVIATKQDVAKNLSYKSYVLCTQIYRVG